MKWIQSMGRKKKSKIGFPRCIFRIEQHDWKSVRKCVEVKPNGIDAFRKIQVRHSLIKKGQKRHHILRNVFDDQNIFKKFQKGCLFRRPCELDQRS